MALALLIRRALRENDVASHQAGQHSQGAITQLRAAQCARRTVLSESLMAFSGRWLFLRYYARPRRQRDCVRHTAAHCSSIDRAASGWVYGDHKLNWMNSTSVGYIKAMISRLVVAAAD